MRWSLALMVPPLVAACWEEPAAGPPLGYEQDVQSCHDGIDNDRDGRIDCVDPDCVSRSLCNEVVPLIPPNERDEDTVALCTNRIDDDDDGNFDCGDRSCAQFMELCCTTEFTDALCSDGIDNDDNGFTDCEDFGCRHGIFVTVCSEETNCDDGLDDDGDGRADCEDSDCAMNAVCAGPRENDCTNGEDDDGDGLTDCDDPDCVGAPPDCIMPEDTREVCTDGLDNDGDGFVDCDDFDCSTNPALGGLCPTENTADACTDGEDNDDDGYTDCEDFGCEAFCADRLENTFERCTDGLDNDANGFADCNDFSCRETFSFQDAARTRVVSPCVESGFTPETLADAMAGVPPVTLEQAREAARRNCMDGLDNDADGFIDCADWDCNWNPLLEGFCEERTGVLPCR